MDESARPDLGPWSDEVRAAPGGRGAAQRPAATRRQRPAARQHGRLRLAHPHRHQPVVRPALPDLRLRAAVVQPELRAVPVVPAPGRPRAHPGASTSRRWPRASPTDDRADRPTRRRAPLPRRRTARCSSTSPARRSGCGAPASTSPTGCWPSASARSTRPAPRRSGCGAGPPWRSTTTSSRDSPPRSTPSRSTTTTPCPRLPPAHPRLGTPGHHRPRHPASGRRRSSPATWCARTPHQLPD